MMILRAPSSSSTTSTCAAPGSSRRLRMPSLRSVARKSTRLPERPEHRRIDLFGKAHQVESQRLDRRAKTGKRLLPEQRHLLGKAVDALKKFRGRGLSPLPRLMSCSVRRSAVSVSGAALEADLEPALVGAKRQALGDDGSSLQAELGLDGIEEIGHGIRGRGKEPRSRRPAAPFRSETGRKRRQNDDGHRARGIVRAAARR